MHVMWPLLNARSQAAAASSRIFHVHYRLHINAILIKFCGTMLQKFVDVGRENPKYILHAKIYRGLSPWKKMCIVKKQLCVLSKTCDTVIPRSFILPVFSNAVHPQMKKPTSIWLIVFPMTNFVRFCGQVTQVWVFPYCWALLVMRTRMDPIEHSVFSHYFLHGLVCANLHTSQSTRSGRHESCASTVHGWHVEHTAIAGELPVAHVLDACLVAIV